MRRVHLKQIWCCYSGEFYFGMKFYHVLKKTSSKVSAVQGDNEQGHE